MKLTCEDFMKKYLSLDKNEFLSFDMIFHLLFCEKCRTIVRSFSKAEKLVYHTEKKNCYQTCKSSINNFEILQSIYKDKMKIHKIHIFNWIFIGVILLICMIFCSIFMNRYIPQMQNVWFVFVAAVICTYCVIFVGMNMDFFIKLTDTHNISIQ